MPFAKWTMMSVVALATMAGGVLPAPAQDAPADHAQAQAWCVNQNQKRESLDRQIAGCTSLIEGGKESADNIAIAFSNRGNAYRLKGELDRAIAGLRSGDQAQSEIWRRSSSIAARPTTPKASMTAPSATTTRRSSSTGDRSVAFNNRGFAYFNLGQHDRAIVDFDEAIRLSPRIRRRDHQPRQCLPRQRPDQIAPSRISTQAHRA